MDTERSTSYITVSRQKTGLASVRFFFINGQTESLKLVANSDGITALIDELREAQVSVEKGRSHLPGDPDWMRSDVRIIAIEPEHYTLPAYSETNERQLSRRSTASRVFFILLFAFLSVLVVLGAVSLFRLLSE